MRLLNKVVLITGANNPMGIGAAVARALSREGAHIAISYRSMAHPAQCTEGLPGDSFYRAQRAKNADEVVASITAVGGIAIAMEADLIDANAPCDIFTWVEANLGPVDILINCAAHHEQADTILDCTADGIDKSFAVNVRATVLLMQQFVQRHRARGSHDGRIVNFRTDSAGCFPGQIAYGASKAAIEALTRSVAREVGASGITVNAIAPGPVQTGYITQTAGIVLSEQIAMARLGTPEDIASAVLYFVAPSAAWTTGQVLCVSGGHEL